MSVNSPRPLALAISWRLCTVWRVVLLDVDRDLASASSGSIRYTWAKKFLSALSLKCWTVATLMGTFKLDR